MKHLLYLIVSLIFICCTHRAEPVNVQKPEELNGGLSRGPAKGKLLLLGGGITVEHAALFKRHAGADSLSVVVIPTAFSDESIASDPTFSKVKKRFEKLGITSINILHTRDREEANNPDFFEPLHNAKGVFILGGRTENLTSTYNNTGTHKALKALLERDGIIAGVSAGSGVLGHFFNANGKQEGLEILEGVIIMNHFLAKNKLFDHQSIIHEHEEFLSLGIDDNTGIYVENNSFEVIGQSYVAVFDGTMYHRSNDSISSLPFSSDRFYLLQNGDRYDLRNRIVESNARREVLKLTREELVEYKGHFQARNKDFGVDIFLRNDTLMLQNSWGWNPYAILPHKRDLFFAANRTMWFEFERQNDSIVGLKKMKSLIHQKINADMEKK